VLEALDLQMAGSEPAQPGVGDEVVAVAGQAADHHPGVDREHVLAVQPAPHVRERLGGRDRLRPAGDERGVQGAGGSAHQQVRRDPALIERSQHPDLHCSQARSAQRARTPCAARATGDGTPPGDWIRGG